MSLFGIKIAQQIVHLTYVDTPHDTIPQKKQLTDSEILNLVKELPEVEELDEILMEFQSVFDTKITNCSELLDLILKTAKVLQFLVMCVLALKLTEVLAYTVGWSPIEFDTSNKKEQKELSKVNFIDDFCKCVIFRRRCLSDSICMNCRFRRLSTKSPTV